jgi:hypothetical protein
MHSQDDKYKKIIQANILNAQEIVHIINDMAIAVSKNYQPKKMHQFRFLCLGYLLIAKNNIEATIQLAEANLVHQLNYISRNMFEMVLTLYYIDDYKHKKNERIKRFYDYTNSIKRRQASERIVKYPDIFGPIDAKIEAEVDQKIKEFREMNKSKEGRKINEISWSGLNMAQMIEALSDIELRKQLTKEYEIIIALNNNFLHASGFYVKLAIKDFYSKKIDFRLFAGHVNTILSCTYMITEKTLNEFSKGRPAFKERMGKVFDRVANLMYLD